MRRRDWPDPELGSQFWFIREALFDASMLCFGCVA